MKHLRSLQYYLLLLAIYGCSAKDWNFYRKNLLQPTRRLQLPLSVQFFGTIRNDSAWNSRTYLPSFVSDLSAWGPLDDIGIDNLFIYEPGTVAQRPLASIVNIAPLIGMRITGPINRRFEYYAYIDSEFLPFGTYFTTEWLVPEITTLLNTKMLINWVYVEGILHPYQQEGLCQKILIGQYSHPMTTTITFPRIVGYSQGAPIVPFGLAPQVKYSIGKNGWMANLTLYTNALYQDAGLDESFLSSLYLRCGLIPGTNFTLEFNTNSSIIGAGVNIQRLAPRIQYTYPVAYSTVTATNKEYAANEFIWSFNGNLYGMHEIATLRCKWQWVIGQNGFPWGNVIGYGVTHVNDIGGFNYKNFLYTTWWIDLEAKCPNIYGLQPGLFLGCLSTLKTPSQLGLNNQCQQVLPEFSLTAYSYGVTTGYQSVLKASPRVWWYFHNNLHIGTELEYTQSFSSLLNTCGQQTNGGSASLIRLVVSTQYNF